MTSRADWLWPGIWEPGQHVMFYGETQQHPKSMFEMMLRMGWHPAEGPACDKPATGDTPTED